jgi:hypothetical protein
MTEQEWLSANDPEPMLEFLRGKASDRKLRLFAVACCRRIWKLLAEEPRSPSTAARPLLLDHERRILQIAEPSLEVAQKYADSLVNWSEMVAAYCDVLGLLNMRRPRQETWAFALVAALRAASPGACFYGQEWEFRHHDPCQCAMDAADCVARVSAWIGRTIDEFETIQQTEATLRDIFGNPFRSVTLESSWLTPMVVNVAQAIYDDRGFDRLPSLGSALEEAGCKEADILTHCQEPGPHVQGCWVVDAVLGRE